MKGVSINWCTCKDHDHKDWTVVADHYCRHFIPDAWTLEYHQLHCHEEGRILYLTGTCDVCGGFMRSGTSVASNISDDELLLYIYREVTRFRPYDGYDPKTGRYCGAISKRSRWYREQDDLSMSALGLQFVRLFREEHQAQAREWFAERRPKRPYCKPRRDRKSTLFQHIMELARVDGSMAEMDGLLDYTASVSESQDTYLTDYRFDVVPHIRFGSNEGVYLSLMLEGSFDSTDSRKAVLGTLKTLRTDLEACRLMGVLGGALMYHARQYIEQEIYRYTPERELAKERETEGVHYGK